MKRTQRLFFASLLTGLLTFLTGCATVVDGVNEDPIRMDPTERSWGNWLDDQTIENRCRSQYQQIQR